MSHSVYEDDPALTTVEEHPTEADGSMTVTFTVGTSAFELGRAMADAPIEWLNFDPSISVGEPQHAQFWAKTTDSDALVTALSNVQSIETLTQIADDDSRTLFEVEWAATATGLVGHLQTCDARLLAVIGTPDAWRFVCRFPSGEQLAAFHDACLDDDIIIELTQVRQ